MTDRNQTFSQAVRAKATELEAIFAEYSADVSKLESKLTALGFGRDSGNQWFYKGQLIPYPAPEPSKSMIHRETI